MAKGKALYLLVQSLSTTEKRHFRRTAAQHFRKGKLQYLRLFDVLEKMPSFDPETLKASIPDKALLRQIPLLQHRLQEHLLSFLQQFNAGKTTDSQLFLLHDKIEILYQRGLIAAARKLLRKARALAESHEQYLHLLRLSDLERKHFFREFGRQLGDRVSEYRKRDFEYIHDLREQIGYQLHHFDARLLGKAAHSLDDAADISAQLQRHLKDPKSANTTLSAFLRLDARGRLALLEQDFPAAYTAYTDLNTLVREHPYLAEDHAEIYITGTTNFLNACFRNRRYTEFAAILEEARRRSFPNPDHQLRWQENLLYLELFFRINRCEFAACRPLAAPIESLLRQYKSRIAQSKVFTFQFNLCIAHFMQGDWKTANQWLSRILNAPPSDLRRDIQRYAPSFQLVLLCARGDRDLLAYRLRAWKRKHKAPDAYERAIVGLAAAWMRAESRQAEQAAVQLFREAFPEKLEEIPGFHPGMLEAICWAESMVDGRLPGDVFRAYVL
ncbi:MAG: hypothetical protein AAF570_00850 [Bacteroidota bacterium]